VQKESCKIDFVVELLLPTCWKGFFIRYGKSKWSL